MRLNSFSDFGFRAMLLLASSERERWSSAELAARLDISRDHLIKVLHRLSAGGYVQTTRGAGGGVRLAKRPAGIRLGDALEWLENDQAITECFRDDGGNCLLGSFCALRPRFDRARRAFYAELNTATLADCLNPALRKFASAPLAR